ncbi:MAG: transglutaminase-like domain-containing protein [Caulobacteraceae bacterium]
MTDDELLADFAAPGVFTDLADRARLAATAPDDIDGIVRTVQGLLIHEGLTGVYRISLPAERFAEKQLHGAAAMAGQAARLDAGPPAEPRPPEQRVVGVCRHFATLFVAILRHKGVPARARCGFATYFAAGKRLDHWVGEYWNADEARWVLVDAQIDATQRRHFKLELDTLDVPRDAFLVAGDAWRACRDGADPMSFGVGGTQMWGPCRGLWRPVPGSGRAAEDRAAAVGLVWPGERRMRHG